MPRILVIDDEPLIRSTVGTILTRAGFSIEEASDGRAGLTKVHKTPPDVVITDIFMPDRDGIEIVMELKRLYPHTKIIAMTGGGQIRMMESHLQQNFSVQTSSFVNRLSGNRFWQR
jgi:CheY-like chemotaxis protein